MNIAAILNEFYTERDNLLERIEFFEKLYEEQIKIIDLNDVSSFNSETCPSNQDSAELLRIKKMKIKYNMIYI